jgi:copper transport protein
VFAALALALTPSAASAHAILVTSNPLPGAELATAPARISAGFTEALNRALSTLTLTDRAGQVIAARERFVGATTMELLPRHTLPRGVYEVRWHSVSGVDGHELDGSYHFGVGTAAPSGSTSSLGDPLAGSGWLRVLLRALADGSLLFLCGGVFCAVLLVRGRGDPARWLLEGTPEQESQVRAAQLWRRVVAAGVLALLARVASTLADAANAGGGLGGDTLHAYLLANVTGVARLVLVGAVALALLGAALRTPRAASVCALVALAALTLSGHPNSASPRGLAIGADLVHLAAAAVWIGGLSQIAWAWLPRLRTLDSPQRRTLMAGVLERFGQIALPAFLLLVVAGVVNAALELGSVHALWDTSYGRVLIVKVSLVGAIALASYFHALRLRPRLLAAQTPEDETLERRHWRLLGSEPVIAVAVTLAAALLVAYAAPNRPDVAAASPTKTGSLGTPGTLRTAITAGEMTVAEEGGPDIVAAFVTHAGGRLRVKLHTLNVTEQPAAIRLTLPGTKISGHCGLGCYTTTLPGSARSLAVSVKAGGKTYTTHLPVAFDAAGNALALALVNRVSAAQNRLRSAVIHESLRGSPTVPDVTVYKLVAPHRFAYDLSRGNQPIGDTIIVGTREWNRSAGQRRWQYVDYGPQPWSALSYLSWWGDYAGSPRLMDLYRSGGGRFADVATVAQVPGLGPVWLRLHFDLSRDRLLKLRMITAGHFMSQAWGSFDQPVTIAPPRNPSKS